MASNNRWNNNPKGEGAMIEVLLLLIQNLKKSLDEWKGSWTAERASKLDRLSNLDRSLSGVENNIGRKIDNLASSSQGSNPNLALSNLINKITELDSKVAIKSAQDSINTKLFEMGRKTDSISNDVVLATNNAIQANSIITRGPIKRIIHGHISKDQIPNIRERHKWYTDGYVYKHTITLPYNILPSKALIFCDIGSPTNYQKCTCSFGNESNKAYVYQFGDPSKPQDEIYSIEYKIIEFY